MSVPPPATAFTAPAISADQRPEAAAPRRGESLFVGRDPHAMGRVSQAENVGAQLSRRKSCPHQALMLSALRNTARNLAG